MWLASSRCATNMASSTEATHSASSTVRAVMLDELQRRYGDGQRPWIRSTAPAGARYCNASRRFDLPGSAMPLVLIMGIFLTKYLVGVELAMQPALARDSAFALQIAALYGAFSGLFVARAMRLWRLAHGEGSFSAMAALTRNA